MSLIISDSEVIALRKTSLKAVTSKKDQQVTAKKEITRLENIKADNRSPIK